MRSGNRPPPKVMTFFSGIATFSYSFFGLGGLWTFFFLLWSKAAAPEGATVPRDLMPVQPPLSQTWPKPGGLAKGEEHPNTKMKSREALVQTLYSTPPRKEAAQGIHLRWL